MSMEGGGATFSAGIALATEVFQEAFKETRYVAQGNGQQRGADCLPDHGHDPPGFLDDSLLQSS